jgi:hypothetical protein
MCTITLVGYIQADLDERPFPSPVYNGKVRLRSADMRICAILDGVLTLLSDTGRFEQCRTGTYPKRPDKIN